MNSLNNSKQLIQPRFSRSAGTTGVHSRVSMKGEERFHNNAWTFIFNVRSRWEIRLDSAIVNYASRIKRVDFLVRVKIGFRSIRDERVLKWTWTNVSAGNGILAFRDDSKFDRSNEVPTPTTANNASSQRLIRADAKLLSNRISKENRGRSMPMSGKGPPHALSFTLRTILRVHCARLL